MNRKKITIALRTALRQGWQTNHGRIVLAGLLVGLCYLPFWLIDILMGTLNGAASLIMVIAIGLGLHLLWRDRLRLTHLQSEPEDQWLGHGLILAGVALAPFCAFSEWSQKLVWIFILIGIACSSWGALFFRKYPIPVALIGFGFFPQPTIVAKAVWQTFMPPQVLERSMAWAGAIGLNLIGQPAQLQGTIITLPGGNVEVAWGCSGFDMATIIATASLLLGIFLKQNGSRIVLIMSIGVVLALLFNIPRIMLMAISEAYWGKAAFEFWHGFWGGQIFSTILFTIYYYAVIAVVKPQLSKKPSLPQNRH